MDLEKLIVKLGLDKSEYDKNLDSAKTSAKNSTQSMQDSFMDSAKTLGIALGSIVAVATTAYKSVIEPTVDFNAEIRKQKQLTGLSAKELSKLTQVGDDWGIEASGMTKIMEGLSKKGFKPSIDNLANLADEYVNAADKTAFMEENSKKYGRQFMELLPIISQGGAALREQTDAINENQLATETSIEQSRRFELAVDALGDQWQGLVFTIGNAVVPMLADYLTPTITETIDGVQILTREVDGQEKKFQRVGQVLVDVTEQYKDTGSAAEKFAKEDLVQVEEKAGATAKELSNVHLELQNISKASIAGDAIKIINQAFDEGLIPSDTYDSLMSSIGIGLLGLSTEEVKTSLALRNIKKGFEDGNIPLMTAVEQMYGLVGAVGTDFPAAQKGSDPAFDALQTDFGSAQEYIAAAKGEVGLFSDEIRNIPTNVDIYITTHYRTEGQSGTDTGGSGGGGKSKPPHKKKAFGGEFIVPPGFPDDSFLVGVTTGEKVIVQTPSQQNVNNWNLTIHSNAKTENLISDFSLLKAFSGV